MFLKREKELRDKRDSKVWTAHKWKEYQLQNIEHVFKSECKQAESEFQVIATGILRENTFVRSFIQQNTTDRAAQSAGSDGK